ncbi:Hypothetical protein D9617_5g067560 [Elsinoe fawcettii]|nr:Hypothetical protein D9617_5g067560 [Elsinoe fawcettii]
MSAQVPRAHDILLLPELLSLILSYLPPTLDEYSVDGGSADDHRSHATVKRAECLQDLVKCSRVCRQWHSVITQSKEHCEALFLESSTRRGNRKYDALGRSWDVPDSAPWLQLNREVEAIRRGRLPDQANGDAATAMNPPLAPQVLRPRRPQSISRAALSALRERSSAPSTDIHYRVSNRSASSNRAPRSGQMYPSRPILNPLLQRYFRNAQFRFNPMHASDSASRYQAHLIIERADFNKWNAITHEPAPGRRPFVPTWCNMHLASPPITSIVAVVWERETGMSLVRPSASTSSTTPPDLSSSSSSAQGQAPHDLPLHPSRPAQEIEVEAGREADQGRTDPFGIGGWDLSQTANEPIRHTGARRSFYRSQVTMSAVPPSAFYSTKQVADEAGLTMGMIMVAVGDMFAGDEMLKAVK